MAARLGEEFFQGDFLDVARNLIGSTLIWDGCGGTVIETEAYGIENDPACHTAFRPTSRRFFAEHSAGTSYVYLNYGVYWLLNVLVKGAPGCRDGIILLRALDPASGLPAMRLRRAGRKDRELCSGPGKLGVALGLCADDHGRNLVASETRFFLPAESPLAVVTDVRVGISRATEFPWRFLVDGHAGVSVPQGKAASTSRPSPSRLP